jgi:hypothetical protein
MAKAKSKNPIGRPRFEVTPEVLARTEKSNGARINQRTMRWRNLGISRSQLFQLYQAENVGIFGSYKKG